MTQPPVYERQFDFTDYSAAHPSNQQPGTFIDAELNAIKETLDAVRVSLMAIQRDDLAVANNTIGPDQLVDDLVEQLSGEDGQDGDPGSPGAAGGDPYGIGLFTSISATTIPDTVTRFRTVSYRAPVIPYDNVGGGWYVYDTAVDAAYVVAHPHTSVISANGRGYRLDLEQQLTWEMLGAPPRGAILGCTISGTTLTINSIQSIAGGLKVGDTVTAAGGTGAVAAGTVVEELTGAFTVRVNISQTVGSTVMVFNDSYPYVAAALELGPRGLLSTGPHWFSQTTVIKGYPVKWSGPNGYGAVSNDFKAVWHYPLGYSAIVAVPDTFTVNAQGDVTPVGSVTYGGSAGWSINNIFFQIGPFSLPSSTSNHRPGIGIFTAGSITNFQCSGADGSGVLIFGNAPTNLADKCLISNFLIQYCYDHGVETSGGDGNTCIISNGIIASVGGCGAYEHGFLGNSWDNIQVQTTAQINATCRRSNNLYYSVADNNIGHDPLSSPNHWELWFASVGADTYDAGTNYRVGTGYRSTGGGNISQFKDCYLEGGSPPALFEAASGPAALTTVYGGQFGGTTTKGRSNRYGPDSQALSYYAYNSDTYAFDTIGGNGFFIGYRANNVNTGPGSPTTAGYDCAINSVPMARFAGKYYGGAANRHAYLAVWSDTGVYTDMQWWSAKYMMTGPFTDNTTSLGGTTGDGTFRWSDVRSVKINGQLPGITTVGDAAKSLTVGTHTSTQIWNTVLTADRAVTLSTSGALAGHKWRIVRSAAATGAFNLNIGTGPLKALGTAGTWADVEYDGSAWVLTGSGSL